ncbi:CCA tRNA nucleotidyltransferase 1, mitochondrial [Bulinus truncatus]|nr:CCA tRNA nucleotidyltransferase 1, mitochondrial [Bulinus truncatus]
MNIFRLVTCRLFSPNQYRFICAPFTKKNIWKSHKKFVGSVLNCYNVNSGESLQISRNFIIFRVFYATKTSRRLYVQPNLKTMQLDTPVFQSLFTEELCFVRDLFRKYNYELRLAGGAVRDLLDGKIPIDLDFATTATPAEMKDMFAKENIRMLNMNGEAHGTITVRINDKENFEITTLRIDVVTDGRRAEVEFTKDWMLDANRRDLTVNSLFLDFNGTVYDYFNGIDDLKQKRVRFVGNAEQRIQEDYLRILRYFRFYGRIAEGPDKHDEETLDAIRQNAGGLARISGERIWMELKKILTGRLAAHILETMIKLDLGQYIGLPRAHNFEELTLVCQRTEGIECHHMTRMSALLDDEADVYTLHERNKISNEELQLGLFIVRHRGDKMGDDLISYCFDLHTDSSGGETKVKNKIVELMKYCGQIKTAEDFPSVKLPELPVTGHDMTQNNVPRGPKIAFTLHELRKIWKESGYKLNREELLDKIPSILEKLPDSAKKKKKK